MARTLAPGANLSADHDTLRSVTWSIASGLTLTLPISGGSILNSDDLPARGKER